jgi:hypothetical protein
LQLTRLEENSFSQIVAHWNALPESVNSFKNRLNNHWKNIEIKFVPDFYGPEAVKDRYNVFLTGLSYE